MGRWAFLPGPMSYGVCTQSLSLVFEGRERAAREAHLYIYICSLRASRLLTDYILLDL